MGDVGDLVRESERQADRHIKSCEQEGWDMPVCLCAFATDR